MDKTKETGLAAVAAAADAVSRADHNAAIEAAKAETISAIDTATADGMKKGAEAERTRIKAIVGSEQAKGRESLASHFAFDTEATVESALAALDKSPKAEAPKAASRLDVAMLDNAPKVDAVDSTKEAGNAGIVAGLNGAVTKELAKIGKTPKPH